MFPEKNMAYEMIGSAQFHMPYLLLYLLLYLFPETLFLQYTDKPGRHEFIIRFLISDISENLSQSFLVVY